jgi:hypothetical protein
MSGKPDYGLQVLDARLGPVVGLQMEKCQGRIVSATVDQARKGKFGTNLVPGWIGSEPLASADLSSYEMRRMIN